MGSRVVEGICGFYERSAGQPGILFENRSRLQELPLGIAKGQASKRISRGDFGKAQKYRRDLESEELLPQPYLWPQLPTV